MHVIPMFEFNDSVNGTIQLVYSKCDGKEYKLYLDFAAFLDAVDSKEDVQPCDLAYSAVTFGICLELGQLDTGSVKLLLACEDIPQVFDAFRMNGLIPEKSEGNQKLENCADKLIGTQCEEYVNRVLEVAKKSPRLKRQLLERLEKM